MLQPAKIALPKNPHENNIFREKLETRRRLKAVIVITLRAPTRAAPSNAASTKGSYYVVLEYP